jgi:chloramphenicol-sensitive protein RarD
MKNIGQYARGILYIILAYVSWGVLPVYWKYLDSIPFIVILAHRVLWSSVFTLVFCLFLKRNYLRSYFCNPKSLMRLMVTGIIVTLNWGVYIYAINSEHIVEAALGYFINPLVSIALGMIFLGEKLNRMQLISFLLAVTGVVYLTINYGQFPWIAIALALTFGVYGLLKKKMNYDSMSALAVETTLIVPIALGYLIFGGSVGVASFVALDSSATMLLILAGIVTALPLYWFGMAAVKIPLYSIGFFQYISPTINLFIGIYLFHEIFTTTHVVSFAFIWAGLALYIVDIVVRLRRQNHILNPDRF